ncbi:DUF167 domain-containing protein [Noviherbaspirillum cavernae]|uniref:DUF167 domain-containing protein n=1 Tax=Noviherbaspirillum cavernae TaxID=2320862 RepID=UPI001F5B09DD|nr:DUF167 domain-containing protein [Noviherbaspirillum cavernae]
MPNEAWCTPLPNGIRLAVQITPNAKKSEVIGVLGEALKIKLQAQPIEGRANEALVRYLAALFGVPKGAVTITQGLANRRKTVEITAHGVTMDGARQVLMPSGRE